MKKSMMKLAVLGVATLATASISIAAVPSPPVNQYLGIGDSIFNDLTEPLCRTCHNQNPPIAAIDPTYLPSRHHLLVAPAGQPGIAIPAGTDAPCADAGWGTTCTTTYQCTSCHRLVEDPLVPGEFILDVTAVQGFRNCLNCHQQVGNGLTVHHKTQLAQTGMCADCHGDFIASVDKGQAAPTYQPSIITPWPSDKPNGDNTVPANTAGTYAGNCNYCHNTRNGDIVGTVENTGPFAPITVYRNDQTHHNTGFFQDPTKCAWCHNAGGPANSTSIRTCERCHDIRSLHNIQYDNAMNGISPGNEVAGYGHIGNNVDCWGCHGNNGQTIGGAADLGPAPTTATVPGAYKTSKVTAFAGVNNAVTMTGNGFQNSAVINGIPYNYNAVLGVKDVYGTALADITGTVTPTTLAVTLPSTMKPGLYTVQAKKSSVKKSNPLVVALKPNMTISSARWSSTAKTVTITGSGFETYMAGKGTGTNVTGSSTSVIGTVVSWTPTQIVAKFASKPSSVTVKNVYTNKKASVR